MHISSPHCLHRATRRGNSISICISHLDDDDHHHLINGLNNGHLFNGLEIYCKSFLLSFKPISSPWPSMESITAKGHPFKNILPNLNIEKKSIYYLSFSQLHNFNSFNLQKPYMVARNAENS